MACPAWRECNKKNCIEQEVCLGDYWPKYWKNKHAEISTGGKCFYCHRPFGKFQSVIRLRTKDHIIPKSKGGLSKPENYKDACSRCNVLKGNMYPEQFAAHLRYLLVSGKTTISKNTLELILDNTEILILEIRSYRHTLVKKGAKHEEIPKTDNKQPTRPSTPLWWRSTLK